MRALRAASSSWDDDDEEDDERLGTEESGLGISGGVVPRCGDLDLD